MKRFLATLFILVASFVLLSIIFEPYETPDVGENMKENFDYSNDNCNYSNDNCNFAAENLNDI